MEITLGKIFAQFYLYMAVISSVSIITNEYSNLFPNLQISKYIKYKDYAGNAD